MVRCRCAEKINDASRRRVRGVIRNRGRSPLGALSDEELEQSIRLLRASIEGGKAAAAEVWAQLDPMVASKIGLILERAGQDSRGTPFERSQAER
jgi:hypothetical protein